MTIHPDLLEMFKLVYHLSSNRPDKLSDNSICLTQYGFQHDTSLVDFAAVTFGVFR